MKTLLARGGEGDVAAAEAAVDRLVAALPHASGTHTALVVLRLRALVARASGDEPTCRELVEHYRAMAASFGLEGSMAWAEAMRSHAVRRSEGGTPENPGSRW